MESTIPIVASIVAGVILGIFSNWLYDILKSKKLLPDNPSFKRVAIGVLIFSPFVLLVAWPSIEIIIFPPRPDNNPPIIESLTASRETIPAGESTIVTVYAIDQDGDPLSFLWSASRGIVPTGSQGSRIEYIAPTNPGAGIDVITVVVTDGKEAGTITERITVSVEETK